MKFATLNRDIWQFCSQENNLVYLINVVAAQAIYSRSTHCELSLPGIPDKLASNFRKYRIPRFEDTELLNP